MNLSSHVPTSSSSAKSLIAPKSPGTPKATGKPESKMRRNSKSDAESSFRARLQEYFGGLMDTATGKPVATEERSRDVHLSESEIWSFQEVTGRPVSHKKAVEKPSVSSDSACQESPKAEWPHHLSISTATAHHTEAVFSIVREIYGRGRDDPMDDVDVNMAIWFFSEWHSSSSSSSLLRRQGELKRCKE